MCKEKLTKLINIMEVNKMLEVFLNDNISEYFFYEENGKWLEELK